MALFGRGERPDRRGTPFEFLIVGLGNPGKEYVRTRHNVGEEVVNLLAERVRRHVQGGPRQGQGRRGHPRRHRCVLAFPLTYMNESGQAVGALAQRYKIDDPAQLIIVHDELDLPPAQIRVKVGGGLAGNNGLRSITPAPEDAGLHPRPHRHRQAAVQGTRRRPRAVQVLPKADREAIDVAVEQCRRCGRGAGRRGSRRGDAQFNVRFVAVGPSSAPIAQIGSATTRPSCELDRPGQAHVAASSARSWVTSSTVPPNASSAISSCSIAAQVEVVGRLVEHQQLVPVAISSASTAAGPLAG